MARPAPFDPVLVRRVIDGLWQVRPDQFCMANSDIPDRDATDPDWDCEPCCIGAHACRILGLDWPDICDLFRTDRGFAGDGQSLLCPPGYESDSAPPDQQRYPHRRAMAVLEDAAVRSEELGRCWLDWNRFPIHVCPTTPPPAAAPGA